MVRDELKISSKILYKLTKNITMKPVMNLSIIDVIDSYTIKKNSPHLEDQRDYRVCLAHLPNDHLVNKFAIKMKNFDINTGVHNIAIKETNTSKVKKWSGYKAIEPHLKDFKYHEEVSAIDIKDFVKFCKDNNITEREIWTYILDNTYSKSNELLYTFYPTLIPIPHSLTNYQQYNSHCLLFTQAKTGKSETCYRAYPDANIEDVTVPTLLGTIRKDMVVRKGLLDGLGLVFIDEINKMSKFDSDNTKLLDFINNYLEKGIEKRGVWGSILEVSGTKTCIFSGNVNTIKSDEKDFYHLMACISRFSNDADKFGRRFAFFVYDSKLNIVDDKFESKLDSYVLQIFNAFRKEVYTNEKIMKRILTILEENMNWINYKDNDYKKQVNELSEDINSTAIQAFLKGMTTKSYKKLKFMALKIVITNNIFEIINKENKNFFEDHEEEILAEYDLIKELLCYKQIKNLNAETEKLIFTNKDKIRDYIKENNIDITQDITPEIKRQIETITKVPRNCIRVVIHRLRKEKKFINDNENSTVRKVVPKGNNDGNMEQQNKKRK